MLLVATVCTILVHKRNVKIVGNTCLKTFRLKPGKIVPGQNDTLAPVVTEVLGHFSRCSVESAPTLAS